MKTKIFPEFRRASRCHLQGNVSGLMLLADVTHRVTLEDGSKTFGENSGTIFIFI